MAKRQKSILSSPIVKYGMYGIVGYYAYCYLTGKPIQIPFMQSSVTPPANVSTFPRF